MLFGHADVVISRALSFRSALVRYTSCSSTLTVRISQSELPENDTEIHYIVVTYVTTLMVDRDAARCSDALAKMQYCSSAQAILQ